MKILITDIKLHPDQPLILDEYDVIRFKQNDIVNYLLKIAPTDIIDLKLSCSFSNEDWIQFYQLIGYSLQLFDDHEEISDEICERVRK